MCQVDPIVVVAPTGTLEQGSVIEEEGRPQMGLDLIVQVLIDLIISDLNARRQGISRDAGRLIAGFSTERRLLLRMCVPEIDDPAKGTKGTIFLDSRISLAVNGCFSENIARKVAEGDDRMMQHPGRRRMVRATATLFMVLMISCEQASENTAEQPDDLAGAQGQENQSARWQAHPSDAAGNSYNALFKRRFKRGIELGFHYYEQKPYEDFYKEIIGNFDAKRLVDNLVRANADWVYFWSEVLGNYFYDSTDTKLGRKHRSLRGRDLLKEFTVEAKRRGLSVLSYSGLTNVPHFARLRPDCVQKDPSGNPVGDQICYNCDEFLELLKRRSSEIKDNYDVDGFFFDGGGYTYLPNPPACFCARCKALFKIKYGFDMPDSPTRDETWQSFLEFRYESNERFTRTLKTYIQEKYPGTIVLFNYGGHIPFGWQAGFRPVGHGAISDSTMAESFAYHMNQYYPSLTASFVAGVSGPDRAFLILTDAHMFGYGSYALQPEATLRWAVFTAKMRGANVAIIDKIHHDYSVEPALYERIGKVYGELAEKEPYFEYPSLKEVGLYFSLRTRDWYGRDNVDKYFRCVVGAYRALVDLHYQVEFVFDESVTLERLQQFLVIYLPNVAILSAKEVQMLRGYVEGGGSIFATWETGLYDELGQRLEDFALGDVMGVRYRGHTEENWNFVRFSEGRWTSDVLADYNIPVVAEHPVIFEARKVDTFGELWIALPGGVPGGQAGASPWKTVGPALAIHKFGKGRSAYLSAPLDGEYSSLRAMAEHRNLIRNIMRHLLPKRQVTVEAPLNVEAVVMQDDAKERMIVHMVGFWARKNIKSHWLQPLPSAEPMEAGALYRAKITADRRIRSAKALHEQTRLEIVGDAVSVETEQIHEAIIISF
ncbi:hypothetical protein MYX84_06245 [Acidobacteria bacterium AH-259-O06]|nr:hypothetical protein [Acidobacteria bacterium AH-259-O06]